MNGISTKLSIVLVVSTFFVASSASAATTINSVKLNGADKITIEGSALITAAVNVSLTDQSVWKSTGYRFGDGNWTCVDTPDHLIDTTATETFSIIAPSKQGTSDVNFEVYGNNDCTNGPDIATMSASLSTAVMNVLSLGTGEVWLSVVLLELVVIIVAFIIFYIVKRTIDKKKEINS